MTHNSLQLLKVIMTQHIMLKILLPLLFLKLLKKKATFGIIHGELKELAMVNFSEVIFQASLIHLTMLVKVSWHVMLHSHQTFKKRKNTILLSIIMAEANNLTFTLMALIKAFQKQLPMVSTNLNTSH